MQKLPATLNFQIKNFIVLNTKKNVIVNVDNQLYGLYVDEKLHHSFIIREQNAHAYVEQDNSTYFYANNNKKIFKTQHLGLAALLLYAFQTRVEMKILAKWETYKKTTRVHFIVLPKEDARALCLTDNHLFEVFAENQHLCLDIDMMTEKQPQQSDAVQHVQRVITEWNNFCKEVLSIEDLHMNIEDMYIEECIRQKAEGKWKLSIHAKNNNIIFTDINNLNKLMKMFSLYLKDKQIDLGVDNCIYTPLHQLRLFNQSKPEDNVPMRQIITNEREFFYSGAQIQSNSIVFENMKIQIGEKAKQAFCLDVDQEFVEHAINECFNKEEFKLQVDELESKYYINTWLWRQIMKVCCMLIEREKLSEDEAIALFDKFSKKANNQYRNGKNIYCGREKIEKEFKRAQEENCTEEVVCFYLLTLKKDIPFLERVWEKIKNKREDDYSNEALDKQKKKLFDTKIVNVQYVSQHILDAIETKKIVICDSVQGSGKTEAFRQLAQKHQSVLYITNSVCLARQTAIDMGIEFANDATTSLHEIKKIAIVINSVQKLVNCKYELVILDEVVLMLQQAKQMLSDKKYQQIVEVIKTCIFNAQKVLIGQTTISHSSINELLNHCRKEDIVFIENTYKKQIPITHVLYENRQIELLLENNKKGKNCFVFQDKMRNETLEKVLQLEKIQFIRVNTLENNIDDFREFFEDKIKQGIRVFIISPIFKTGINLVIENSVVFGFYNYAPRHIFSHLSIQQQIARVRNAEHIYVNFKDEEKKACFMSIDTRLHMQIDNIKQLDFIHSQQYRKLHQVRFVDGRLEINQYSDIFSQIENKIIEKDSITFNKLYFLKTIPSLYQIFQTDRQEGRKFNTEKIEDIEDVREKLAYETQREIKQIIDLVRSKTEQEFLEKKVDLPINEKGYYENKNLKKEHQQFLSEIGCIGDWGFVKYMNRYKIEKDVYEFYKNCKESNKEYFHYLKVERQLEFSRFSKALSYKINDVELSKKFVEDWEHLDTDSQWLLSLKLSREQIVNLYKIEKLDEFIKTAADRKVSKKKIKSTKAYFKLNRYNEQRKKKKSEDELCYAAFKDIVEANLNSCVRYIVQKRYSAMITCTEKNRQIIYSQVQMKQLKTMIEDENIKIEKIDLLFENHTAQVKNVGNLTKFIDEIISKANKYD